MADAKVTVAKFIEQVREVDRIKISTSLAGMANVTSYDRQIAPDKEKNVGWWLDTRIMPHLPAGTSVKVYDRNNRPVESSVTLKFVMHE